MPFLTGSEEDTDLSWDSFAYPAADLSGWQPDPDNIPETGGLPDARFTKVSNRVRGSGYSLGKSDSTLPPPPPKETRATSSSVGTCSTSVPRTNEPSPVPTENEVTSTALGNWPTPVLRAPRTVPASTLQAAPTTCVQNPKGTMETLFTLSSVKSSRNPGGSSRSGALEASEKASGSSLPSKLAKMRQDTGQELAPLHRAQPQPVATSATTSIPPHLRKRQPTSSVDTVWTTPASEHPPEAEPELQQVNKFPSYSVEAETRTVQRSEDIDLQKAIAESLLSKKLSSSVQEHEHEHEHDRYLDSKLIGIMEAELDVPYRTTHSQLRDMSEKEFKLHFQHTKEMHKSHWNRENNIRSNEADANITLTAFQEREQLLYGQRKASFLD